MADPFLRLNLGCGSRPVDGWVNVDRHAGPGVDVVHDLDVHPWPWPDGSAVVVRADHVIEHVGDVFGFMREAARVLAPRGVLELRYPYWRNPAACWGNPDHKRIVHPYGLGVFAGHETADLSMRGTEALFARHAWRLNTEVLDPPETRRARLGRSALGPLRHAWERLRLGRLGVGTPHEVISVLQKGDA